METIQRIIYIGFCIFASLTFAHSAIGETEKPLLEIDRLAPEHVEQATFALG